MDMPIEDALAYLIMIFEEEERKAEEEHMKYYMDHISRLMTRQPNNDEEQKRQLEFTEDINPDNRPDKKAEAQPLEWDFEIMKQLEEAQY